MANKQPWYPTKQAWAEAQAAAFRKTARELRHESSCGRYSRAARKYENLRNLENRAQKFDRMARKFQATGQ